MNTPLILLTIAGRSCALSAQEVQTVIELEAITAVPRAPGFVIGLTALRSQTLTVLDTRMVVGHSPADFSTDTRAVVIEVGGHSYALRVDQIRDVGLMQSDIQSVATGFGEPWADFARGMVETGSGLALLLDPVQFVAACEVSRVAA